MDLILSKLWIFWGSCECNCYCFSSLINLTCSIYEAFNVAVKLNFQVCYFQAFAWFSDLLVEHAEIFWSLFAVDMDQVLAEQPPDTWDSFPLFQILNDYLRTDGKFSVAFHLTLRLLWMPGVMIYGTDFPWVKLTTCKTRPMSLEFVNWFSLLEIFGNLCSYSSSSIHWIKWKLGWLPYLSWVHFLNSDRLTAVCTIAMLHSKKEIVLAFIYKWIF